MEIRSAAFRENKSFLISKSLQYALFKKVKLYVLKLQRNIEKFN